MPAIAQPVSVCHQWSMTGTLRLASAHLIVSGSARSPANSVRMLEVIGFRMKDPWILLLDGAERHVGAVSSAETLCWRSPARRRRHRACQPACPRRRPSSLRAAAARADVGVAHDPSDIRGGPEHLARLDAVVVPHRHFQRDHVAAVVAHDAFRLPRRARRIEDVERIGRGDWHACGFPAALSPAVASPSHGRGRR